jgi:hypothetical protein
MSSDPSVEDIVREQGAQIRNLQESVSSLKAAHAAIKRDLRDSKTDSAQFAAISSDIGRLRALQETTRATFRGELQGARGEFLAEIRALRDFLLQGPPPAPAADPAPAPPPAAPAPAPPAPKPAALRDFDFPFNAQAPLEGVIAGLTRQVEGNVADRGVVAITASGCLSAERFPPKAAADLTANSVFVSKNEPGQWLCYDFQARRVRLTGYALRSRFDGWVGSNHPRSWVVEVSPDGAAWAEADRRDDSCELNGTNLVKAFELPRAAEGRCVRLRQTAPAHSGKHFLALSGFELFGSVLE